MIVEEDMSVKYVGTMKRNYEFKGSTEKYRNSQRSIDGGEGNAKRRWMIDGLFGIVFFWDDDGSTISCAHTYVDFIR